jgi:hypothetical protein
MVAEVRRGRSMRSVAKTFRVSLHTVQRWVTRAADGPLDEVDWVDRPSGDRTSSRRTKRSVERRVLTIRRVLKMKSDLGEYGAAAIRREMLARNQRGVPSLRTIGRILERGGALDGRRRMRHKAPPRGWFLSGVRAQRDELDSFDMIEDLALRGGRPVNVLTGISLHGALGAAWPGAEITAKSTVESLIEHWRAFGLPAYAKVRQRYDLPGEPSSEQLRPRDPLVPDAEGHADLRTPLVARLPGRHRSVQSPLAGGRLAAIHLSKPGGVGDAIAALHRSTPGPTCRAYRRRPEAAAVSGKLAVQSAAATAGRRHVHPGHQPFGPSHSSRSSLRRQSNLVWPTGPR